MASLTSANVILMISIDSLYASPVQIQGFAVDDVFDIPALAVAETMMGVDGILSGGYVNVPVPQTIALQADSVSNQIFDTWGTTQKTINDIYYANMTATFPSLGIKYTLTRGILSSYSPLGSPRKVLQPRRHTITWQSIFPQPSNTQPNN